MADNVTEYQDQARFCCDPECIDPETGLRSLAEPESDGDHRYSSCTVCGNDFGYEKIPTQFLTEDSDGSCAIGVPAEIRKQASAPMEKAIADEAKKQPVPIQLKIGRSTE